MRIIIVGTILCICLAQAEDMLQPTTSQPGTKEENGIVTTLALTYVKVRNTVRDAYMSIQYTRAMVQTLDDQKAWVRRNLKSWDLVGKRVVKLVSEPGRWDQKLQDLEAIFDKTDYLLWDESRAFDDLMYRQERYAERIGGHLAPYLPLNHPAVTEFYKFNSGLYRSDPSWVAPVLGGSKEEIEIHGDMERSRLRDAYAYMQSTQEGKVRDATILAGSRAQAQIAALRRVQQERMVRYRETLKALKDAKNVNAQELGKTLSDLKGVENTLDELAVKKLEMEVVWAHIGTLIYDLSRKRAGELRTTADFEVLGEKMEEAGLH